MCMLNKMKSANPQNKGLFVFRAMLRIRHLGTGYLVLSTSIIFVSCVLFSTPAFPQVKELKPIYNGSFKPGEKFRLRVHYGFLDAGFITMEIDNEVKNFGN